MAYNTTQTINLTQEDAKDLAQRIFTTYDVNKSSILEENEIGNMMVEIYRLLF